MCLHCISVNVQHPQEAFMDRMRLKVEAGGINYRGETCWAPSRQSSAPEEAVGSRYGRIGFQLKRTEVKPRSSLAFAWLWKAP